MAVPTEQSASAASQRSVLMMRDAISDALAQRTDRPVEKRSIPMVDPGPNFPRSVPEIPGLTPIARSPAPAADPISVLVSKSAVPKKAMPEKAMPENASENREKASEWHIITPEGATAVGQHHELLYRTGIEEKCLPEVVLVHGNPDDEQGEAIRIRLCNQDGEPTSLEDLELEEIPDVVPFVDRTDPLNQLIDAWPELDTATQDAILTLVKAAVG